MAFAGAVSGTVYDSGLNPVSKAVVEAFALPSGGLAGRTVAQNGSYSLGLGEGNYSLRARIMANGTEYSSEENLSIGAGEQKLDIIVFSFDASAYVEQRDLAEILGSNPIPFGEEEKLALETPQNALPDYALPAALALALGGIIAAFLLRKRGEGKKGAEKPAALSPSGARGGLERESRSPPIAATASEKKLSAQEKLVLGKIRELGGRVAQRDLRKNLDLSEASVSMALTELEDMGLVQKIKKGRGNIVKAA
ncbi:MAG: carboxypeptidase regulatory-like domain-containing protein [Candidatus Micrarchaeia archaeon]